MKLLSQRLAVFEIVNHCPQTDSARPFLDRHTKLTNPFKEGVTTRDMMIAIGTGTGIASHDSLQESPERRANRRILEAPWNLDNSSSLHISCLY
jgi:hypothetical protein